MLHRLKLSWPLPSHIELLHTFSNWGGTQGLCLHCLVHCGCDQVLWRERIAESTDDLVLASFRAVQARLFARQLPNAGGLRAKCENGYAESHNHQWEKRRRS